MKKSTLWITIAIITVLILGLALAFFNSRRLCGIPFYINDSAKGCIVVAGCSLPKGMVESLECREILKARNSENSQMANPASVYCEEHLGRLEIRTSDEGSQTGYCLRNGKECEEWAFFRGECVLE
jgi:putative hemolysin